MPSKRVYCDLSLIFRFDENGKIVEHWDVVQIVREKSANNNICSKVLPSVKGSVRGVVRHRRKLLGSYLEQHQSATPKIPGTLSLWEPES